MVSILWTMTMDVGTLGAPRALVQDMEAAKISAMPFTPANFKR